MLAAILLFALLAGHTWKDFLDWYEKHGPAGAPSEVLRVYSAALVNEGLSEPEAQAHVAVVQAYIETHPREALTAHFNRMYTWAEAPFSREPSALVKKVAATRKPGKALDIAMGQGRNAVWLAKQGWIVSGYDISPEGLRQADAAAAAAGVKLDTKLASHDDYDLGQSQWDLIVMSFAFTRLSDTAYMKRVHDSLRPAGVLIVEGFNSGKPSEPNMILKAFLDYRVLLFEDLPGVADWGRVKAPLLRIAVERP